jgi:phosphate transport system substrate-binding protein
MRRLRDIFIVVSMFFLLPHLAAKAQSFIVQGSTAFSRNVMIPYQAAIESSSGHKLTVVPNKSSLGILALFEKRADFAMISGPLEIEIGQLKLSYPHLPFDKLQVFNVSKSRMAFAVNEVNPVQNISDDKMRDILLGKILNWRDVGGSDLQIRVVHVREGGGVQATVENEFLNGKRLDVQSPIRVQISSQVVKVVEQLPEALGLSQLDIVINSRVAELKVDHPIEQQLNLVTFGSPTPEMLKVINVARNIASTAFDRQ